MKFEFFQPSGILANYIKQYWLLETDQSDGSIVERVIPNGTVDLMFHYKKELFVKTETGNEYTQPKSFISGISSSFADVHSQGEIGMICVEFYPFAANCFFQLPLKEIENTILDLESIYNQEIKDVEELIAGENTSQKKINFIEKFLLSHLQFKNNHNVKFIKEGLKLIKQQKGNISINELSRSLCTTPKTLERKFATYLGKTPKQYSKIIRFQQMIYSLSKDSDDSYIDLIYHFGFYDQAHFIKEFKSLSGYTPKEFAKIFHPTQDFYQ